MNISNILAHSSPDSLRPPELLAQHLRDVSRTAEGFAAVFGWGALARACGLLHDIGKTSAAFQAYLAQPPESGRKGPDHSTAGAREAEKVYPGPLGRLLAYAIAGHHAGLADFAELRRRIKDKVLEPYDGWQAHAGDLPVATDLPPTKAPQRNVHGGFSEAFLTRMIFSCLVDADFLATERFFQGAERARAADLRTLEARLAPFLASKRRDDTEVNRLRARVLDHVMARAAEQPGLFTLTVPTGGGKTLTSLAFAIAHARAHGLRRVIYVIPYTSIIEQTAAVFREALGTEDGVLEHHASFDWDAPRPGTEEDGEGRTGLRKLRQAAENWDTPVVVTTAVQFFESLFANGRSRCRKLHNIAGSVVVLDEAQTLPLRLLLPCMAALTELAANYRTSVVLCTATQPALRTRDGFVDKDRAPRARVRKAGFNIDGSRELAPDPPALFRALARVTVERRPDPVDDETIAARFAEQDRMLCIVNNRRHARDLFDRLKADERTAEGAFHLTTLMCPVHRRSVLDTVRQRLLDRAPARLVATSLIEAGVDVDFPEVWRALTGLDSIAQAAGRCNREGALHRGRVVVFEPAEKGVPRDLIPLIQSALSVFRQVGVDPLSPDAVQAYFQDVYWSRGAEAMDAGELEGRVWPILDHLADRARGAEWTFDLESIAPAFRVIDDDQATVIVPFDQLARVVLRRLASMDRPHPGGLRKLQQYAVSIPKRDRDAWLALGVLTPVHERLGDGLLRFMDLAHYRVETGVDLRERERRDAASNIA